MARATGRAVTSVCHQLVALQPDREPAEQAVLSTATVGSEDLDEIRRQLRELAERRLLVQLNAAEVSRYHELCSVERAALSRRDVTKEES